MTGTKQTVIIVGAGFGGLTAAIECQLRGFQAVLIEKYASSIEYGDIIDFFPNGGRVIEAWDNGKVGEELMKVCMNNANWFRFYKYDGTLLHQDPWLIRPEHYMRQYAGHRGEMHSIILDYAKRIGVECRFGSPVVQYLEDETSTGVILRNGSRIDGICVIAADGPRSMAREQILGLEDKKVNSGYAIYRAFFQMTDEMRENPLLDAFANKDEDTFKMWLGPHVHMLGYCWKKGKDIAWVITHKDDADIGESWSFPGEKVEAAKYIKNFEPECKALVNATPEGQLVDYKLVWRDPLTTWISKGGRSCLIGDAAHCHLPTSGQGGSQAIEDGVAVAVCLQRAQGDVKLALKVFERIRYNRSLILQMAGVSIRDQMHDIDNRSEEPTEGEDNGPREEWVIEFDVAADAEKHFEQLAKAVRDGRQGTIEELALPGRGSHL